MKQSFLDSLKGKLIGQAKRLVIQHGYDWAGISNSAAQPFITPSNVIILWHHDGLVVEATRGDKVERCHSDWQDHIDVDGNITYSISPNKKEKIKR